MAQPIGGGDSMALDKPTIRKTMLEKRQTLAEEARAAACGYVCEKILNISLPESPVIAGYMAMRGEVNIYPLFSHLHTRKIPVCMTVVSKPKRILDFVEWVPDAAMKTGEFGTVHPEVGSKLTPNLLLVPIVAFDQRGYRIGYGGGYYDATIASLRARNPALLTVGIGYSFQEVPLVPDEAHDVRLSMVVTEKDVINCHPAEPV